MNLYLRSGTIACALATSVALAAAQTSVPGQGDRMIPGSTASQDSKLQLTPAQKTAIFQSVSKDKANIKSPPNMSASVGAQVPPSAELYILPDNVVADSPAAKAYKYTIVQNQVLLVDPTTMRVVEVIRQ
jgi:hypothetical protein